MSDNGLARTLSIFTVVGQIRAEFRCERSVPGLANPAGLPSTSPGLTYGLDLEYAGHRYSLHVDGPRVQKPWSFVFTDPLSKLPPEFVFWAEHDLFAVGAGNCVAVFRLSSGEVLLLGPIFVFYSFMIAEDLNRLIAIGEVEIHGLGINGQNIWALQTGEIASTWARKRNYLVITDMKGEMGRIDILTGEYLEST